MVSTSSQDTNSVKLWFFYPPVSSNLNDEIPE
jgi:hypothetical protein